MCRPKTNAELEIILRRARVRVFDPRHEARAADLIKACKTRLAPIWRKRADTVQAEREARGFFGDGG